MSGQTLNYDEAILDGEWPDRLRRGVHLALKLCEIEDDQWSARELDVHHIVAAGLDGAAPARRILARWSVKVHSLVNAAVIPRRFHQGHGLHRQEFLHMINLRISSAAMFAEAILPHGGFAAGRLIMVQAIQKIGTELVGQSQDLVAIQLQDALQALVARSAGGGAKELRSDVGARAPTRAGRERFHATSGRVRLGSVAVSSSRRPCLQHAAACP